MSDEDESADLLKKLLADLYGRAAHEAQTATGDQQSYLVAADGQFLGAITDNNFDQNSIRNEFGPYGSQYSSTSIFNEYGQYGGEYGQFSPKNPYSSQPPSLFIRGKNIGQVTANEFIQNRIPYDAFLYTLKNDINSLLRGKVLRDEVSFRRKLGDTFIRATDGTFLGSLNPNNFDTSSIFNKYGPHGSQYSPTSIFNKYGTYGGKYSSLSPFNERSVQAPTIYEGNKPVARLSVNKRIGGPVVDPNQISTWAKANVRKR